MNLLVDIQFGQAAALGVIGHTDGHWPCALCYWHRDLKQLRKEQKSEESESYQVNHDKVQQA